MKSLDRIPDWVILVLAVLLVAGVFKLFGGIGVLVLAIISQSDASSLSRPRRKPGSMPVTDADKAESRDH